jgi:hypothetical protein
MPTYIPIAEISRRPLVHTWSDWDPFEVLQWPDEEVKRQLALVSNRGITAFALGCAEWTLYRLCNHVTDDQPFLYVDAFWYFLMGGQDLAPPETDSDNWQGAVRGPINLSLMTVLNTIYLAEDAPPVQNGALAARIALHVLIDTAKFLDWQQRTLVRLTKCFPRSTAAESTAVVPQVLDPDYGLESVDYAALVIACLDNLQRTSNPYIQRRLAGQ